jgi:hypothetical protein
VALFVARAQLGNRPCDAPRSPVLTKSTSLVRRGVAPVSSERATALVQRAKNAARVHVPLPIRIERKRLMRVPSWLLERGTMASTRVPASARTRLPHALAAKHSPLCRGGGYAGRLQQAKEQNVRRVSGLVNGFVGASGETVRDEEVLRNVAETAYTPKQLAHTPRVLASDAVAWDAANDRLVVE